MIDWQKRFCALVQLVTQDTRKYKRAMYGQEAADQVEVQVHAGRKYTRIDRNDTGYLMVDNETGVIYGIKGYGRPHKGHVYGNLDTARDFNWGAFYPSYAGRLL